MIKFFKKAFLITYKLFCLVLLSILLLFSLFYLCTTVYNFPAIKPFSGKYIYNPYQTASDTAYRANFHAHSKAWKGVTNGNDTEKDIYDGYTNNGYDIACISNYHHISTYARDKTNLFVPVYEHGYNILKSHYLVIHAKGVSYFDFPLLQTTSQQQQVIESIRKKSDFIAVAHPKFGGGRTFEDVQKLTGYNFMEVLNHYRVSDQYWDAALSAGRLPWVLGDDDIHELKTDPAFRMWTVIFSRKPDPDTIMYNMNFGRHYAVESYDGMVDNALVSCRMTDSTSFRINLKSPADSVIFIGQEGSIKRVQFQTDTASYRFGKEDTYVRTVICNKNSRMFLNPLIRYDGLIVPFNYTLLATENYVQTWTVRVLVALLVIGFFWCIRIIVRKA
jgi:hypothetical protein